MTPRERVLAAFAHREPDRVPLDYHANLEIDHDLKDHFGLPHDQGEALADRLGVDFRGVYARYIGPQRHASIPGRRVNEWGVRTRWVEHSAGGYWDFCDFPLAGSITEDQVDAWPMPTPDDYDYDFIPAWCDAHQDYAVVLGGAGVSCIMNTVGFLRGMGDVFCDVATEDPAGMRLIDRMMDVDFEIARRALKVAGHKAALFCIGEDLGTQRGPIVDPEIFRRIIRPRTQRYITEAKKYNLPVMMHSCGSSSWAFDDLADMGVDIMDTLQPEAANMDPAYLKKRFGHKLSFHGMLSTAGVLAFGTVEQVKDEVRRLLDIMMPGGGFALAPTHAIQSNSPVENVLAMYETARGYGVY